MQFFDDHNPFGSDFGGGALPLPVSPTAPGPALPGSDFAGGSLPTSFTIEANAPGEAQAA